jgi:hypothetical protein
MIFFFLKSVSSSLSTPFSTAFIGRHPWRAPFFRHSVNRAWQSSSALLSPFGESRVAIFASCARVLFLGLFVPSLVCSSCYTIGVSIEEHRAAPAPPPPICATKSASPSSCVTRLARHVDYWAAQMQDQQDVLVKDAASLYISAGISSWRRSSTGSPIRWQRKAIHGWRW